MSTKLKKPVNVAVVAFDGMSMFHLSVPIAIFQDAAQFESQLFNLKVCADFRDSTEKHKIKTANRLSFDIEHDISVIDSADIVIVPSWVPKSKPSDRFIAVINQAYRNNKFIVGLCLGAYALAYTGVLDGKKATTHWKYGEDFSSRFPFISCKTNPLYLVEDNVITSAGSAAAIDCCLFIVKHFYGIKIANKIARIMVSSPERAGGQHQYIENPTIEKPNDKRIAKLLESILRDIAKPVTLEQAANNCLMSVRSFSRHFKASNGISFTAWLVNTRLNYSLELLESTSLSITEVSTKSGFSSEQIFRKHFKSRFDSSPKVWRGMFNKGN